MQVEAISGKLSSKKGQPQEWQTLSHWTGISETKGSGIQTESHRAGSSTVI
jgi:hypothetical protein